MTDNDVTARPSSGWVRRLAPLGVAYCAAWAAFLSSDWIAVPFNPSPRSPSSSRSSSPSASWPGLTGQSCSAPSRPLFAFVLPGAIPPDADIPDYGTFVALLLAFPIVPVGVVIALAGVWARGRSRA